MWYDPRVIGLLRSSFGRDVAQATAAALILGALLAAGGSFLAGRAFDAALKGMVGASGEYDAIVHIREEAKEAADPALRRLLGTTWAGARLERAITVAGTANFLLGLPPTARTEAVYTGLESAMQAIPGFAGLTFIVEPTVVVRAVHPALRDAIVREMKALREIRAAWVHGDNIIALVRVDTAAAGPDLARQSAARAAIQDVLDQSRILTVRRTGGFADADAAAERLAAGLVAEGIAQRAEPLTAAGSERELQKTLAKLQEALLALRRSGDAARPGETLAGGLEQSAALLDDVHRLVAGAGGEPGLQRVLEDLGATVQTAPAGRSGLLPSLLRLFTGGADANARAQGALDAIRAALMPLLAVDWEEAAREARQMVDAVPALDEAEIEQATRWIGRYLSQSGAAGDRLEILVDAGLDPNTDAAALRRLADAPDATAYAARVGVAELDVRALLAGVVDGARRLVVTGVALIVTLLTLLFDHALVMNALRAGIFAESPPSGNSASGRRSALVYGAITGALLLAGAALLAQGGAALAGGGLELCGTAVSGGLAGVLAAALAPRLAPLAADEIEAARSLGLSPAEILREVVVPEGRPGVLAIANRLRCRFI